MELLIKAGADMNHMYKDNPILLEVFKTGDLLVLDTFVSNYPNDIAELPLLKLDLTALLRVAVATNNPDLVKKACLLLDTTADVQVHNTDISNS